MGLNIRGDDLAAAAVNAEELKGLTTKVVFGNDSSLMYAVRPPGYHSKPHRHAAEQLNYVVEGELHLFVGRQAFLVRAGDFFRVPINEIHWSWNRSEKPVVLVESHAPGMGRDPLWADGAEGLFAEGEQPDIKGDVQNEFVSEEEGHVHEVEDEYFRQPV